MYEVPMNQDSAYVNSEYSTTKAGWTKDSFSPFTICSLEPFSPNNDKELLLVFDNKFTFGFVLNEFGTMDEDKFPIANNVIYTEKLAFGYTDGKLHIKPEDETYDSTDFICKIAAAERCENGEVEVKLAIVRLAEEPNSHDGTTPVVTTVEILRPKFTM